MKRNQIEILRRAVEGYCEECLSEETAENLRERSRIEAAWTALQCEQKKGNRGSAR